jgi:hypothetical protein
MFHLLTALDYASSRGAMRDLFKTAAEKRAVSEGEFSWFFL